MKAQCLSSDIISTLPSTVIETILCLVPIKDAVRTSVLSKKWRYNWTKIPKLVFNENDMFDYKKSDANQVEQNDENQVEQNDENQVEQNEENQVEQNDVNQVEQNDENQVEQNVANQVEQNDANQVEQNDENQVEQNDANQVDQNDANQVEQNDANQVEQNDEMQVEQNDANQVEQNDENENESEQSDEETPNERKQMSKRCKVFYAIYQVLLMHRGPIEEFSLSMDADVTCVEIDQIIVRLLRHNNTLKKFTLDLTYSYQHPKKYGYIYWLPLSFFSLNQLTDLYLHGCHVESKQSFNGFPNLTNLSLNHVSISVKAILHMISSCPLLKRFSLLADGNEVYGANEVTFAVIFKCLPLVEHLSISHWSVWGLALLGVPRELPTALVNLKYLYLERMAFFDELQLSILGLFMRSSPNLEKLKIQILAGKGEGDDDPEVKAITLEQYSDIWLENLNELEIVDFTTLNLELEFVKLIMVKSPVLKKVKIVLDKWSEKYEELDLLKSLLRYPRASPNVEIIVEHNSENGV